jgi:hypothetical protein
MGFYGLRVNERKHSKQYAAFSASATNKNWDVARFAALRASRRRKEEFLLRFYGTAEAAP